jgi:Na+/proline symporter
MLILGGSATVTDLTGMNTVAACFLIPLGVSVYVLAGGMRASLIADYSHTIVLYAILLAFAFTVYATSPILGSPARVWELLREASIDTPVEGNAQGSYLTMRSKSGLIFGVLNIVGNFGTGTLKDSKRVRADRQYSTIKHTGNERSLVLPKPVSRHS